MLLKHWVLHPETVFFSTSLLVTFAFKHIKNNFLFSQYALEIMILLEFPFQSLNQGKRIKM